MKYYLIKYVEVLPKGFGSTARGPLIRAWRPALSGLFYGADRYAEGVFAVQELQENYYAFGTVAGQEDSVQFLEAAAVDAHAVTGFECQGLGRFFAELLAQLRDEFVCHCDRLLAERHQLVHPTG